MPKFQFTNKAIDDLSEIWNYTFDNWSEDQADRYYSEIIETCIALAETKISGKKYQGIVDTLKGVKINKHIIFYRQLSPKLIEINRILHERMDLKNRMSEK